MRATALLLGLTLSATTAPAARAYDEFVGSPCFLVAVTDRPGIVHNDPKKHVGVLVGGPYVVFNLDDFLFPIQDVTITCTIQLNNSNPGAGGVSRTSTTPGSVGLLGDSISYYAQPGDLAYLCTFVEWNSVKGHYSNVFDPCDPVDMAI
jgi:hypothetical protein